MGFTKRLPDESIHGSYDKALQKLISNARVRIGHIDTGLTRHPALGFKGKTPPPNIELADGADFMNPGSPPLVDAGPKQGTIHCLLNGGRIGDCLSDYPDHGTKTLSIILSNNVKMKGVAPGARIIPVRIADGPIFQEDDQRDNMGRAMKHLLDLPEPPRVITISMGNPGHAGLFQVLFSAVGASSGFNSFTESQFKRAWEMGVIVCCAAGQVIDRVIFPARYKQTIGVGGFFAGGDRRHYPVENYDLPERVDVWAQASGINRAVSYREGGTEHHVYSEDEENIDADDVSGTSYATPQVAAAAALWVETHWNKLPRLGAGDGWKTVESFRKALVKSADVRSLRLGNGRRVNRPCLNVNRLVRMAPDLASVSRS